MSNNLKPQLVERACYQVATRYSPSFSRPATISMGGFYWKSHTPASAADAAFINRTVEEFTPVDIPPTIHSLLRQEIEEAAEQKETTTPAQDVPVSDIDESLP